MLSPSAQVQNSSSKSVSGTLSETRWTHWHPCACSCPRFLVHKLGWFAHVQKRDKLFVPRPCRTVRAACCILVQCVRRVSSVSSPLSPPPKWTARASRRASGWCRRLTCGRAVRPAARMSTSYGCFWRRYRAVGSSPAAAPPKASGSAQHPFSPASCPPAPVCQLGPVPGVCLSLACIVLTCCAQLLLSLTVNQQTPESVVRELLGVGILSPVFSVISGCGSEGEVQLLHCFVCEKGKVHIFHLSPLPRTRGTLCVCKPGYSNSNQNCCRISQVSFLPVFRIFISLKFDKP